MNKRAVVVRNEFEASLLSSILSGRDIPHIVRSYHDSAYDGLWQTKSAWGFIEAPEEYCEKIKLLYEEIAAGLSNAGSDEDSDTV